MAVSSLHFGAGDMALVVEAIRRMHSVIGFGVTIPYKVAILPPLDQLSLGARDIARSITSRAAWTAPSLATIWMRRGSWQAWRRWASA